MGVRDAEEQRIMDLRQPRWWFGGVSSSISVLFSHPMDLLKVSLQTSNNPKDNVIEMSRKIYKYSGLPGFYNGSTASMMRQMLTTGSRIAIYDMCRPYINLDSFHRKVMLAGISGILGSIVGYPADVVNVRVQSDIKLPPKERRQYKNVFDGIKRIYGEEGLQQMYSGYPTVAARGMFVSIASMAVYEQLKQILKESGRFPDNEYLHFSCSLLSSVIGTTLVQPLDIVKTRVMAASPGQYKNVRDAIRKLYAEGGYRIFWRGYWLNFLRICPHTIVTFMLMEQLRMHWGYLPN